MSDEPTQDAGVPTKPVTVSGGGGGISPAEQLASDPVRNAAAKLELLSPETRELVLSRMDPEIALRIREFLASQPDNRPHGSFSHDVATRRQLIHEVADRVAHRRTVEADQAVAALDAVPQQVAQARAGAPAAPADPLDNLRTLHPAAIARAMQGERAEAWAIVLDRLDSNARAALQLYLDATAQAAIDDARARQAELAATSPALIATIVAAIARTVVPRAMREHHQLLSSTPLAWSEL
jgi:hypothetical protein